MLTGRLIFTAAGTLTIIPVCRLARRVRNPRAALAAAFFLAVAVLHVRDSHFAMTDVLMTLFVMLSLARLVSAFDAVFEAPSTGAPALRGFAAAGLLARARHVHQVQRGRPRPLDDGCAAAPAGEVKSCPAWTLRAWTPLIFFTAAAVAGFVLGTPYRILDAPAFLADFRYDLTHLSEPHGLDVGPGWYAHLTRSLPYGCGVAATYTAAIAGMGIALRRAPRQALVLVAFVLAFLGVLGTGRTVFFRYVMPLVPLACVFAGITAAGLGEVFSRRRGAVAGAGLPTLIAVLVIGAPSLVSSAWMDVLLARTDSRIVAGQWLRGQLRPEHSVYDAGRTYVRLDLHGADYHQWIYDPRTQSFGDPDGRTPHWLVITESPLRTLRAGGALPSAPGRGALHARPCRPRHAHPRQRGRLRPSGRVFHAVLAVLGSRAPGADRHRLPAPRVRGSDTGQTRADTGQTRGHTTASDPRSPSPDPRSDRDYHVRMRIGILTNEFPPHVYGGAGVHGGLSLPRIAATWMRAGSSTACSELRPVERSPNLEVNGVQAPMTIGAQDPRHVRCSPHCSSTWRGLDCPRASTSCTAIPGMRTSAAVSCKQLQDMPLVLTVHSLEPLRPWKLEQLVTTYALLHLDRTDRLRDRRRGRGGFPARRRPTSSRLFHVAPGVVRVIHNGIDLQQDRPRPDPPALSKFGIDPAAPFVLFVGRITRQKGIVHLVRAIQPPPPRESRSSSAQARLTRRRSAQ